MQGKLHSFFEDPLGMSPGEPLDPRWTKKDLDIFKSGSKKAWFSVFQQNPKVLGGTLIQTDMFKIITPEQYDELFPQRYRISVRGWDLAFSEKHLKKSNPSYTSGAKLTLFKKGKEYAIILEDVRRWQKTWPDSKRRIIEVANEDGLNTKIVLESGGPQKGLVDELKGDPKLRAFSLIKATPVVDKVARANYWSEKMEDGKFYMVSGHYTKAFIEECEVFDNGINNDQVDSVSIAYWQLAKYLRSVGLKVVKIRGLFR